MICKIYIFLREFFSQLSTKDFLIVNSLKENEMPFGLGKVRGRRRRGNKGGQGLGQRDPGRRFGIGRPENCICPSCGAIIPHRAGFPCFQMMCPQCGTPMTRQFVTPNFSESTRHIPVSSIPQIDTDLCTGCGKCIEVCPVDAITLENKKAIIDEERCNACRACISSCPNEAIK